MGCVTIDPTEDDCDSASTTQVEEDEENMFGSKSWKSRAFWFLISMMITGILVAFGGLLIWKHKEENVRVVSKIKINQSPFPVVTVCNLNPYKSSMIGKFPHLAHLVKQFDKRTKGGGNSSLLANVEQRFKRDAAHVSERTANPPLAVFSTCNVSDDGIKPANESFENATTSQALDSTTEATDNDDDINRAIDKELAESETDQLSRSAIAYDMIPYIMAPQAFETRISAGYSTEEMILKCMFDGRRCTHRNFTLFMYPNYGNCYSFNADGYHKNSRRPGASSGLSLESTPGPSEYLNFVETGGFRVIITERGKPILPDASGINVLSGSRTSVSLRMTAIRAISTRRKPCVFTPHGVYPYYYEAEKYSTEACSRSCYQRKVIDECQCGDPRIPLPVNNDYCSLVNRSCVNANYDSMDGVRCQCPLECSLDQYDAVVTMSGRSRSFVGNTTKNYDTAGIDVYLEDSTVIEYREQLAYTPFLLWWDFSNMVVTWTGRSVMIVFILVIDAIRRLAMEMYHRKL